MLFPDQPQLLKLILLANPGHDKFAEVFVIGDALVDFEISVDHVLQFVHEHVVVGQLQIFLRVHPGTFDQGLIGGKAGLQFGVDRGTGRD